MAVSGKPVHTALGHHRPDGCQVFERAGRWERRESCRRRVTCAAASPWKTSPTQLIATVHLFDVSKGTSAPANDLDVACHVFPDATHTLSFVEFHVNSTLHPPRKRGAEYSILQGADAVVQEPAREGAVYSANAA